jgi:lipopolysaccharide transport system ATP-binding protein
MPNSVVSVNNITKKYYEKENNNSLSSSIEKPSENFALHNVCFELSEGNVLGVFGKNGSGKTTLAKILSGIVKPTSGEAYLHGKTGSVLDIGIGFHPDLNGIENIYINGSLLGFKKQSIAQVIDEIIEFSELENSINKPVKFYSNGMYLRLAFSILLHLDIDILILDEIFAVGDIGFKKKSKEKLLEKIGKGLTCIIISHQPDELLAVCTDYLYLESGRIKAVGKSPKILFDYMAETWQHKPASISVKELASINGKIDFNSLIITSDKGDNIITIEDDILVTIELTIKAVIKNLNLAIHFYDERYKPVFTINTVDAYIKNDTTLDKQIGKINLQTKLKGGWLRPGKYHATVSLSESNANEFRYIPFAAKFEISATNNNELIGRLYGDDFLLHPHVNWEIKQ